MGAHFEALDKGVLLVPLDPSYTQVGFNLIRGLMCFIRPYTVPYGSIQSRISAQWGQPLLLDAVRPMGVVF